MKSKRVKIKHAVVLVNYGSCDDTLAAIASIKKTKDVPHIIVIDNGSDAIVVDQLRSLGNSIELLTSDVNLGFSGANNLGIKRALRLGAQVIYLLNNDTLVDPNLFFRAYRSVAGKNRLVGGKIYYAKGYEYDSGQKTKAIYFGMLAATMTQPWQSHVTLESTKSIAVSTTSRARLTLLQVVLWQSHAL